MLLESIVDGQFPIESVLPSEGDLALKYGMSRLTVREAVRILRGQNIVTIRRGRGTFVNPPQAWTSLDAVVRIEERRSPTGRVSGRLIEARRMVEVGAAQLAATNRSKEDLDSLAASIEEMRLANRLNRVDLFVEADIAFHCVIMHATANMFIPFMFEPFGNLLVDARTETSSIPEIRVNAISAHELILEALTAGDPEKVATPWSPTWTKPKPTCADTSWTPISADPRRHPSWRNEMTITRPTEPTPATLRCLPTASFVPISRPSHDWRLLWPDPERPSIH